MIEADNKKEITILEFGHIPSWAGGKQESGLANVIYNLSVSMSKCKDLSLYLAATDFFQTQKVIEGLTIIGWQKKTLLLYAISHPFFAVRIFLGLLIMKLKYKGFIDVPSMLFKSLFLKRTIAQIKPQIVHLHGAHSLVYLQAIPSGVKVVLTHHGIVGNDPHIPNSNIYARFENDSCHNSRLSKLFFISNKLVDDFSRLYGSIDVDKQVILDAYDNAKFYYVEHELQKKLVLITIASFSDNKGQTRVIEAIGKSGIDCKYVCVGASSKEELNKAQSVASKYDVDFIYIGKLKPSEIRSELSKADYMILPSSTEGFGLVFLESIACGVPVLLPKHLPIVQESDIIIPDRNAILIDDSSVEAIIKTLSSLKHYNFDRESVSKSIIRFTWDSIGDTYAKSLINICNN